MFLEFGDCLRDSSLYVEDGFVPDIVIHNWMGNNVLARLEGEIVSSINYDIFRFAVTLCVRIVVSDLKSFCGSMKLSQEGDDHDELFP